MEKTNLDTQIIRKLNSRAESVNLFLDCYDETDSVDLYIFDLIAYILKKANEEKDEMNKELECYFFNLFNYRDSSNEIGINVRLLSSIIKVIDNYKFSPEVLKTFRKLFVYNEILMELDYKLDSKRLSMFERVELKKQFYSVQTELRSEFEMFNYYLLKANVNKGKDAIYYNFKNILEKQNIDLSKFEKLKPTGWKRKKSDLEDTEKQETKPRKKY